MISRELALQAYEILGSTPDLFFVKSNQALYDEIVFLTQANRGCDPDSLTAHLRMTGKGDLVGGEGRVWTISLLGGAVASVPSYCNAVLETAARRAAYFAALRAQEIALDMSISGEQVTSLYMQALDGVGSLLQKDDRVVTLYAEAQRSLNPRAEVQADLERNCGFFGVPSGFFDCDSLLGGWQKGKLYTVAGRPGMGKSAFGLQVARFAAERFKRASIFFSLEMSNVSSTNRIISTLIQVPVERIQAQRLSPEEQEIAGRALASFADTPLFLSDESMPTVHNIHNTIKRIKREHGEIGVVVIDYLQLIPHHVQSGRENRVQEISFITRYLKGIAMSENIPIIALSQLSRGVESRQDKRPMLSDLRDSGTIEQDSDVVVMLYRDEYYNPDSPERGIAEVIVSKHRDGPTGTVRLLFEPQTVSFLNLLAHDSGSPRYRGLSEERRDLLATAAPLEYESEPEDYEFGCETEEFDTVELGV